MPENEAVLFWRNERWHAGWLMQTIDDSHYVVGWIEGGKLLSKTVEDVIRINVSAFVLMTVPR